jgi:tRNA threonylcarbamoyladenosine biosynthesis protein TsaB
MRILAIETATEACSAALLIDDEVIERFEIAPREHGNLILPMVDELLLEAGMVLTQLDALAFGRGPGSFTGVRMATGVVQGLAFGASLPVAAISTLRALAAQANLLEGVDTVYAALDARMGEVYWAEYQRQQDELILQGQEQVIAPELVRSILDQKAVAIGHGWSAYEHIMSGAVSGVIEKIYADKLPRATEVAKLAKIAVKKGEIVSPENALPVYLRDNVAKKKKVLK